MIKFENTEVVGLEPALRGMRNPMNSWGKADSKFSDIIYNENIDDFVDVPNIKIGPNDHKLAMSLRKAGPVHRKYLRMINVYVDITAPLYWWKEFDTYKVGTVANSCSTMHKIQAKEFELDDFSHEHLFISDAPSYEYSDSAGFNMSVEEIPALQVLNVTIKSLNHYRKRYLDTKDKSFWWQMIQLLPSSYNQKRTVMMSYETLANIMQPDCRLHHKLDEWNVDCAGSFCAWVKGLPYSEFITGGEENG